MKCPILLARGLITPILLLLLLLLPSSSPPPPFISPYPFLLPVFALSVCRERE
jgi:hypothetical protein